MATYHSGNEMKSAMTKYINGITKEFIQAEKKLSMEAFKSLVNKTAKDTRFAAHNQSVAIDSAVPREELTGSPNVTYTVATYPTLPDSSYKLGSVIIIYNNTKYIIYLEKGIGQRPQPMVAPTMQILKRMADQLLLSLSRKNFL